MKNSVVRGRVIVIVAMLVAVVIVLVYVKLREEPRQHRVSKLLDQHPPIRTISGAHDRAEQRHPPLSIKSRDQAEQPDVDMISPKSPRNTTSQPPVTVSSPKTTTLRRTYGSVCDAVIDKYNLSLKKFVMALSYWEQLITATNNFFSLSSYFKGFGAWTVQPFFLEGELYSLPSTVDFPISDDSASSSMENLNSNQLIRDLDTVYNMSIFQKKLCEKYSMPPFASFYDFLAKAPRELTILNVMYKHPKKGLIVDSGSACSEEPKIKLNSEKLIKILNNEAKKHSISKEFTVKRICCVHKKKEILPSEIARGCDFIREDSFSAVFMLWRGHAAYTDWDRFYFPDKEIMPPALYKEMPSIYHFAYPLSNAVLSNATAFYKDLAEGGKQLITFHFRTEWMAMRCRKEKQLAKCYDKVWQLEDQLQNEHPDAVFRYFTDFSPFGSHTFGAPAWKNTSKSIFKKRQIEPEYYRVEKYGGIPDQGFVALVEQVAMAKSDILVLVGRGNFQIQLELRFRNSEKGSKIYGIECKGKPKLKFHRT